MALAFASAYPDRLQSLVLSDGPGTAAPVLNTDLQRMEGSGFFRWVFDLAPEAFVHTALRNGYRRRHPTDQEVAEFVAAYRDCARLAATMSFIATYPKELPEIEAGLSRITIPSLLLWGAEDEFVPPENAQLIHARLRQSEVTLLEGTGHFSNDDNPEGWGSAVVRWCLRHSTDIGKPAQGQSHDPAGARAPQ